MLSQTVELARKLKRFMLHMSNSSGLYYSGHYYSPVPASADIKAPNERVKLADILANLSINYSYQQDLFREMIKEYPNVDLPEVARQGKKYFCKNSFYSHMDGMTLSMMIRILKPVRIIEIGSGFSSAAILDTSDSMPGYKPYITFIEPDPERLINLIGEEPSIYGADIIKKNVQSVDLDLFNKISKNDFLIIDSSHVVKYGSDLSFIFFKILPRLMPGAVVHFHDIWKDFEYPLKWLREGIYWNESYFLRAFLAHNNAWEAIYMTDYMSSVNRKLYEENMPDCLISAGSSFYIRKVR